MKSTTEIPPPRSTRGGCLGKGCLTGIAVILLLLLSLTVCGYFFVKHSVFSSQPAALTIEELPPGQLAEARQEIQTFESKAQERAAQPSRPLQLTGAQINGLLAANKRSRGHAYVVLRDNAATVQVSLPAGKLGGADGSYLNASFVIETDSPTTLEALRIQELQANGWPVSSRVLQWQYRGRSILSYALEAIAPYRVQTIEIRDGTLIATRASDR